MRRCRACSATCSPRWTAPGPETALVGLGSNLGDRLAHLRAAVRALELTPGVRLTARSRVYETDPVGGPAGQGAYLNAAVGLETTLDPPELLGVLLGIERSRGRERRERWGPRTLDLDLLTYGSRLIRTPDLIVPHPRLLERAFVLVPVADVAGDLVVPGTSAPVARLAELTRRAGMSQTRLEL